MRIALPSVALLFLAAAAVARRPRNSCVGSICVYKEPSKYACSRQGLVTAMQNVNRGLVVADCHGIGTRNIGNVVNFKTSIFNAYGFPETFCKNALDAQVRDGGFSYKLEKGKFGYVDCEDEEWGYRVRITYGCMNNQLYLRMNAPAKRMQFGKEGNCVAGRIASRSRRRHG